MKCFSVILTALLFSLHAAAKTHVEIAEDNAPSIVAVNVVKNNGSTFTGTGFIVAQDGLIATSRHVVEDSLYINVTFSNGVVSGPATVLAALEQVDLALIQIQAHELQPVTIGYSDTILPGEGITVIGNPRRLQNSISSGLISQVRQKSNGVIWHQISAPISPSSSGSPVFNADGEVISIAFSSYKGEGNQNLNFSVPSNYLIRLMQMKGYSPLLPQEKTAETSSSGLWGRFCNHVRKSWDIVKKAAHPQS